RRAVRVQRRAFPGGDLGERHAVADEPVRSASIEAGRLRQRDILSSPEASHMSSDSQTAPPYAGEALETLIRRCLGGDQVAWELIVRQYWRKVFNIAYKFVGRHDEAEDLAQDVFLKIFKSLNSFDRRANFQTWLISVSRNLCIDHYRSV